MDVRQILADKGYDPQTADQGMGWICTIEVNRRIQTFRGTTEQAAVTRAAEYVAVLEERYEEQMGRLRCDGCGE